jgi:long-chain acyl-CoA synthetase
VERKKDMIISEGFNVYPREIEEFLLNHPGIEDSAVIGISDRLRGERVIAYVVLGKGVGLTQEEIIKYCRDNLVRYKVPKKIIFKAEIPTNIAGKKLRRLLREDFKDVSS